MGGGRLGLISAICVSRPRSYLVQILQATLIKWAKSAVANMAVLTRIGNRSMYYLLMEVSGWWSDVMVLTLRVKLILIMAEVRIPDVIRFGYNEYSQWKQL